MRIIAGPCQHESYDHSLAIAKECKRVCDLYGYSYYFKASYDKANRSSLSSKRGLGLEHTLDDFGDLKRSVSGLQILTDVHETSQVHQIAEQYNDIVNVIQIPAFLSRQTDLITAACQTDKIVNIKKGQFMAPWDIHSVLSKTRDAVELWITERGTSFGYNTLVVDFTGLQYMMENYHVPIVFDVTHSVQKPGGHGSSSGGNRDYVPGLARAASALGVKNFFLEVHDDPDNAPSDGDNMIHIDNFETVIREINEYSYINSSKVAK